MFRSLEIIGNGGEGSSKAPSWVEINKVNAGKCTPTLAIALNQGGAKHVPPTRKGMPETQNTKD